MTSLLTQSAPPTHCLLAALLPARKNVWGTIEDVAAALWGRMASCGRVADTATRREARAFLPPKLPILLSLLLTLPLSATPTLPTPTISPANLTANTATQITATCQPSTTTGDPTLLPNGLNLTRRTSSGVPVSVIGTMHDDGLNGDATANDGIYTLRFTTTEPTPGTFQLECAAAYRNTVRRVRSTTPVTVSVYLPPTLTTFTPQSGPTGTAITLTGTNLAAGVALSMPGTSGTPAALTIQSATATSITALIPTGAATGPITATNPAGATATTTASFTLPPTITSFTPTSGATGTIVTITGTNLGSGVTLAMPSTGSSPVALTIQSATATSITAVIPSTAATGPITATNSVSATATSTASFTVIQPPTITSFTPTSGPTGTVITITGTNLSPGITLSMPSSGSSPVALTIQSATATSITAVIPATAATGTITATNSVSATATSTASFTVIQPPTITSFTPTSGATGTIVTITGTNLGSGVTLAMPSTGSSPVALTIQSATATTITALIPATAATGPITATNSASVTATSTASFTVIQPPTIISFTPTSGPSGTIVTITGTNLSPGVTLAMPSTGSSPVALTIQSATATTLTALIPATAATGTITATNSVSATATSTTSFTVTSVSAPTLTTFSPTTGTTGTIVAINGTNFVTGLQFSLPGTSGAPVSVPLQSMTSTTANVVIPVGAATGAITITTPGGSATTAASFTVNAPNTFTISASPASATLIQGQAVSFAVQLASANGFNQLAPLSLSGLPAGVTASFAPTTITAGQTAILTLTAPVGQPVATSSLSISAAATVAGIPLSQSTAASVSVVAPTTTLTGRTVVSDAVETPLAGVTVTTMGLDGNGNTTGCANRTTVADSAGNFALTGLPAQCTGPQLISFDGTTATSPAGKYAGVNLVFTLVSGQVTASPVLVHLPRIDNVETFLVTQNAATDQSYSFKTIPGLAVTVYKGTKFTLSDGTQPDPFPLAAVAVPTDRLPDAKPNVPTMIRTFIVAFQPANTNTNAPVAVYFPNTLNTAPGTDMPLMTLDPTHGTMVPYGTGAVSSDGTQIIPDADPAHPGHLYGLIHFDWHGPMPTPPSGTNPGPSGNGPSPCAPGGNPGGGHGPGDCGTPGGTTPPTSGGGSPGGSCPLTGKNDSIDFRGRRPFDGKQPPADRLGLVARSQQPSDSLLTANLAFTNQSAKTLKDAGFQPESAAGAGDPVDLASGLQVLTTTDLSFSGSRGSVALVRTYRSLSSNPGPFGIGTGSNYGLQLDVSGPVRNGQGVIKLIMPDGNQYPFSVTSTGTYVNTSLPVFSGAVLSNPASGTYNLRYRTGLTYGFQTSTLGPLTAFLTAITDPNGNTTTLTLNPSQPLQITKITDPVGRSLTLSYDGSNRVTSAVDPINRTVRYTYNAQGTLATYTDPLGGTTFYGYDGNNNMIQITDPRGNVQIKNTLDANGRVVKQVRPDGGTLTFAYIVTNPLAIAATVFVVGSPSVPVLVSPMMSTQVTDSLGVQTTYRFNVNGFITDITSSQGQTTHFNLQNGTNLRLNATFASATTSWTYDAGGNVLTVTDPTGLTTAFTYDLVFSKISSITDPLGNIGTFAYDSHGNLTSRTDANSNTTSYQYNSVGLMTKLTDALQQSTAIAYDGSGNPVSLTDPLGNTTKLAYDGISRLTQTTDALGRRTSFTYDALGRRLTSTDPAGGVTTAVYDPNGNLLSIRDAKGNTNSFTYDSMNRLVSRTDGLGNTDARTWDADGNLIQYVDRRGLTSTYAYDNLNRLTTETYSDATVTRNYDTYGCLVQADDSASGKFTFSYDLAGRLLSTATPFGVVNYTYDGRGMMASREVVGQPVLFYTYDAAGRLTSTSLPQASASFTYSTRNQLLTLSRSNNVVSTYSYDADGRLLGIQHTRGAEVIASDSYGYDAVGNRLLHATSIGQSLTTTSTSNTFNAANQLSLFGNTPYVFDKNGGLTAEGTNTAYTWDGRTRLKSIRSRSGQTTNLTYDFRGNLLSQTDVGPSLNLSKSFVLDNHTNLSYVVASDGTSYSVLAGRAVDSHLGVSVSSGQTLFGLSDGINSTIATVDQSGNIQHRFSYEPFGEVSNSDPYPFQYTGRMSISSGLNYNRARFYSSSKGRFSSEDAASTLGKDVNLYRYVRNNPIGASDPSGHGLIDQVGFQIIKCLLSPLCRSIIQGGAGWIAGRLSGDPETPTAPDSAESFGEWLISDKIVPGFLDTVTDPFGDSGNVSPSPPAGSSPPPDRPASPSYLCDPTTQCCPVYVGGQQVGTSDQR